MTSLSKNTYSVQLLISHWSHASCCRVWQHHGREITFRWLRKHANRRAVHVLTNAAKKYGSISVGGQWNGGDGDRHHHHHHSDGHAKDVLKHGKRQRAPSCHNKVDVWRSSVVEPGGDRTGARRPVFDRRPVGNSWDARPAKKSVGAEQDEKRSASWRSIADCKLRNMWQCGDIITRQLMWCFRHSSTMMVT